MKRYTYCVYVTKIYYSPISSNYSPSVFILAIRTKYRIIVVQIFSRLRKDMMNLKVGILLIAALLLCPFLFAQYPGWQQKVDYKINVEVDHETHKLKGVQQVVYTNNSNETLDKIYFHLYFNAFQPGSMMDIRSNTIMDPDKRVGDRISKLKPSEVGYMRVVSAMQGSKECGIKEDGTILEVELANPIRPGESTNLLLNFNAQIPLQIRRSGRHSSEGIFYSMAQWYPKVCGFD